jgi:hypothetical protein
MTIVDFTPKSELRDWYVVDDVVMGGRSDGGLYLNEQGNAVFEGKVSLENNGGFSSIRHRFEQKQIADYSKVVIRLKGDGKRYQFRIKPSVYDRHAYISYFETTGDWQTVELPLDKMYPTFRGRSLDMPNFPGEVMEEIAFLIANKKNETFKLEIDRIELQ